MSQIINGQLMYPIPEIPVQTIIDIWVRTGIETPISGDLKAYPEPTG